MTNHAWKLKDYGSGWSAREISDDMNDLARGGWEVNHINSILEGYDISKMPTDIS